MVAMTVRLPDDLHENLRQEAFTSRRSMNAIVEEGILTQIGISPERYGDLCALFEAAWHHVVPKSPEDMLPLTSDEARTLAMLAWDVVTRPRGYRRWDHQENS